CGCGEEVASRGRIRLNLVPPTFIPRADRDLERANPVGCDRNAELLHHSDRHLDIRLRHERTIHLDRQLTPGEWRGHQEGAEELTAVSALDPGLPAAEAVGVDEDRRKAIAA